MASDFDLDFMREDLEDDAEPVAHVAEESGSLYDLALEMESLREELDDAEEIRKVKQARFDQLRKKLIPDAMRAAGMVDAKGKGSFTTASGATFYVKNDVYAHYVKADEEKVFAFLRRTGNAAIIKQTVNANTLKALAREMLEEGQEMPAEIKVNTEQSVALRRGRQNN